MFYSNTKWFIHFLSTLAVFRKGACCEGRKLSLDYLSLRRSNDFVDIYLDSLFGIGVVAVLVVLDEVKVVIGLLVIVRGDLLVQDIVQLEWKMSHKNPLNLKLLYKNCMFHQCGLIQIV